MAILLDTCVYIKMLRGQLPSKAAWLRPEKSNDLWLSSVVLQELYAGALPADYPYLSDFAAVFRDNERILVPNLDDWKQAGIALNSLGRRYGFGHIKRARMTNDALIAMSCARTGISLLTMNSGDFNRLAEFREFERREPALALTSTP